jgi:hypothetical protein
MREMNRAIYVVQMRGSEFSGAHSYVLIALRGIHKETERDHPSELNSDHPTAITDRQMPDLFLLHDHDQTEVWRMSSVSLDARENPPKRTFARDSDAPSDSRSLCKPFHPFSNLDQKRDVYALT